MVDFYVIWANAFVVIVSTVELSKAKTNKGRLKAMAWIGICLGLGLYAAVKVFAP